MDRVGFSLDLYHQVQPTTISVNHFRQGGDQGKFFPDGIQRHVSDTDVFVEQPAGIRVVEHHRNPVAGPAHIQLNAPDPCIERCVKCRQGVFKPVVVIVLTAVRDDATGLETMGRRRRTGPSTIDPVHQPVENPFGPFFHPWFAFRCGIQKSLCL